MTDKVGRIEFGPAGGGSFADSLAVTRANSTLVPTDKLREMQEEIARLREALQRIVSEADSDDGLTAWDGAAIARAALEARNA